MAKKEDAAEAAARDAGTDDAGGAGFVLWQLGNLWQRRMRRALSDAALTHVQFILLAGLAQLERRSDGPVTQSDLAAFCRSDAMMTSQVLRTLEAAGLVTRVPHPHDTRAKCPALTRAGHAALARAAPAVAEADRAFFALAGRKGERLVRNLRKLRRRVEDDDAGAASN
ncbi:MAG: MarR family winged helix-turn-helix transcriptional regulator [Alphaproteobacteria bacterium]